MQEAWILDDTGFPKFGRRLGRGGAPVLRGAGQGRQLPDRGLDQRRDRRGVLSARLAPVHAGGVGCRTPSAGPRRTSPRSVAPRSEVEARARDDRRAARMGAGGDSRCWPTAATAISPSSEQGLEARELDYVVQVKGNASAYASGRPCPSEPAYGGSGRPPSAALPRQARSSLRRAGARGRPRPRRSRSAGAEGQRGRAALALLGAAGASREPSACAAAASPPRAPSCPLRWLRLPSGPEDQRGARPSTGSRTFPPIPRSQSSSTSRSCAGGSSTTTAS